MTTATHTTQDPIAQAVLESPDIEFRAGEVLMRTPHGDLLVTTHALDQFAAWLDDQTRELFPHLRLEEYAHRVAAIFALLRESVHGRIQNRTRPEVWGYRSEGWFFVVKGRGERVVVTCYAARGAFYGEDLNCE